MSEDNPRYQELQSTTTESGGLGAFQFSLMSMFVVMTAMAVILSVFISVGRLVGMTTTDVLGQGLMQFLFLLPTFLVWIIGITMAFRRRRRNRVPAILTMIALGVLVVASLVLYLVQMVLMHAVNSGQISHEIVSWGFGGLSLLYMVVHTTCWILILVAIFRRQPPDVSRSERTDPGGDPVVANLVDSDDDGRSQWEQA